MIIPYCNTLHSFAWFSVYTSVLDCFCRKHFIAPAYREPSWISVGKGLEKYNCVTKFPPCESTAGDELSLGIRGTLRRRSAPTVVLHVWFTILKQKICIYSCSRLSALSESKLRVGCTYHTRYILSIDFVKNKKKAHIERSAF